MLVVLLSLTLAAAPAGNIAGDWVITWVTPAGTPNDMTLTEKPADYGAEINGTYISTKLSAPCKVIGQRFDDQHTGLTLRISCDKAFIIMLTGNYRNGVISGDYSYMPEANPPAGVYPKPLTGQFRMDRK